MLLLRIIKKKNGLFYHGQIIFLVHNSKCIVNVYVLIHVHSIDGKIEAEDKIQK